VGTYKLDGERHKAIILPYLTLRKEHKLREFENRMLRRIFVPKREEVKRSFVIYDVSTIRVTKSMRKIDETCSTHR